MHNILKISGLPGSSKPPVPAFGKMYNCLTIGKSRPPFASELGGEKTGKQPVIKTL